MLSGELWDVMASGDAGDAGIAWWAWWIDLQPTGRAQDDNGVLPAVEGLDWTAISQPGKNGIFMVLVGLVLWRSKAKTAAEVGCWILAVNDVIWVLGRLEFCDKKTAAKLAKAVKATAAAAAKAKKTVDAKAKKAGTTKPRPKRK